MDKKKLIFDMDGTLLNTMDMWDNFIDGYNNFDGNKVDTSYIPNIAKSSSLSWSVELMKDYLKESITDEEIAIKVHSFLIDFYSSKNHAKKYVKKTVNKLYENGYEMYVATATDLLYATAGLKSAGILNCFKKIYAPDSLGIKKHDPAYYDQISFEIEVKPQDAIFFDDASYAIDLAKKHGYNTVGVKDGSLESYMATKEISDYFVNDFSNLIEIIEKI